MDKSFSIFEKYVNLIVGEINNTTKIYIKPFETIV